MVHGQLSLIEGIPPNTGGCVGEGCEYISGGTCVLSSHTYDVPCRVTNFRTCAYRDRENDRRNRISAGQGHLYDGMPKTGSQFVLRGENARL